MGFLKEEEPGERGRQLVRQAASLRSPDLLGSHEGHLCLRRGKKGEKLSPPFPLSSAGFGDSDSLPQIRA